MAETRLVNQGNDQEQYSIIEMKFKGRMNFWWRYMELLYYQLMDTGVAQSLAIFCQRIRGK